MEVVNYLNYEIRIAKENEVQDALFFAMSVFMETEAPILGKERLDLFINEYYNNPNFVLAALNGNNPIVCCFDDVNKKMIGAIAMDLKHDNIVLWYVDKENRYKGIGHALYRYLINVIIERFPTKEYSYVEDIPHRVEFYQNFGFEKNEAGRWALYIKHPLNLEVRECEYSDIDAKANLHRSLYLSTYRGILPDAYLNSLNYNYFRDYAQKNSVFTLLAFANNKLIGFITYSNNNKYDEPRTAEILDVFVHPDYFGYGVGGVLLEKAYERIPYKRIVAHVLKIHKTGVDFFNHRSYFDAENEKSEKFGDKYEIMKELVFVKPNCNLTKMEAIEERTAVRNYRDEPIEDDLIEDLEKYISIMNNESGLHFKLVRDNPEPFRVGMNHYGVFTNVHQYFAIMGPKGLKIDEKCGYYGERLVIHATQMGLGTCWVTITYDKSKCKFEIPKGDKLVALIPVGIYDIPGKKHKSKPLEELYKLLGGECPKWFINGVKAAQLAPTAMNQQKFTFSLLGTGKVLLEGGSGVYTDIDKGIAKYHFEVGTDGVRFGWKL